MSPRKTWARIESGNLDVRFEDLLRLAYAFGYQLARRRGSHHILVHSEVSLMLNLQPGDGKAKALSGPAARCGSSGAWIEAQAMNRPGHPSRYHINVFWSEEDECWIADVPDLRFCSAHGETPAQAVAEVEIAMAAWLETAHERGIPIPEARYRPSLAG